MQQFFIDWFFHMIAVALLVVVATIPICKFHKFFLGYENEGIGELSLHVLMTVLVASICIFFIAHFGPLNDFE